MNTFPENTLESMSQRKNISTESLIFKSPYDTDEETKMSSEVSTNQSEVVEPNSIFSLAENQIDKKYKEKQKRDIWGNSKLKNIRNLDPDDVGSVGEQIISNICKEAKIVSEIDGTKTGGIGDGTIKGKYCEIKTATRGSSSKSFQHELAEEPWKADFMIFLDIAPEILYITIFPNFPKEFYKKSGVDSSIKCCPYFPTKSITWRKQKGAFKLDTTIKINEKNKYTFISDNRTKTDYSKFKSFVDGIIK